MNETLRRATILAWFSRKAAQDFSIDGTVRSGVSSSIASTSVY
jgi:hypothetical protein